MSLCVCVCVSVCARASEHDLELNNMQELAQSAGAREHTDCIYEEESYSPNECPGY